MRQRGNQPGAQGNVRPPPKPPAGMHPVAVELWEKVVDSLPSDWFPAETEPLLEAYVTSYVIFRTVNNQAQDIIEGKEGNLRNEDSLSQLDTLRRIAGREIQNMASLATRMRLAQSSTKSKGNTKAKAPALAWETKE